MKTWAWIALGLAAWVGYCVMSTGSAAPCKLLGKVVNPILGGD